MKGSSCRTSTYRRCRWLPFKSSASNLDANNSSSIANLICWGLARINEGPCLSQTP